MIKRLLQRRRRETVTSRVVNDAMTGAAARWPTPAPGSLDVGCGDGVFSSLPDYKPAKFCGSRPRRRLRKQAEARGLEVQAWISTGLGPMADDSFDVVHLRPR